MGRKNRECRIVFIEGDRLSSPPSKLITMNNPLENGSQYDLDSIFDHLIQFLEIDSHQPPIPEKTHHNIMSVADFHGYAPHHPDFDVSNSFENGEYYQGLHSSFISDLDPQTPEFHPHGTDLEQFNPSELVVGL